MKLLLWLVILLAVVLWLLHGKKSTVRRKQSAAAAGRPAASSRELVQCTHCGVHLPASEAVASPAGAMYCSREHLLAHDRF